MILENCANYPSRNSIPKQNGCLCTPNQLKTAYIARLVARKLIKVRNCEQANCT